MVGRHKTCRIFPFHNWILFFFEFDVKCSTIFGKEKIINKIEAEREIVLHKSLSHNRGINFGGLKTAWVGMIPLILQLIFLREQNHKAPEILNDYPYYWILYLTQMFTSALMASLFVISI